jgi:hypothetical protein
MNAQPERHPFLDDLAETVIMSSTILRQQVEGRELVLKIMKAAGSLYVRQTPQFLGTIEKRTFFEYQGDLADGGSADGLVSIRRNDLGEVIHLNIMFSPLGSALSLAEGIKATLLDELGPHLFL